ncbi:unnamed protein product [Anisakis simplex]|uniref:G_PROTEIN_RECEP_F1_2 domain-containing protein n=1 Tax=Anisakis simplex TaxID=6269 RepID=A0A0M3J176_ANISI|nr:unnamed protein product [Anisakis simplex]
MLFEVDDDVLRAQLEVLAPNLVGLLNAAGRGVDDLGDIAGRNGTDSAALFGEGSGEGVAAAVRDGVGLGFELVPGGQVGELGRHPADPDRVAETAADVSERLLCSLTSEIGFSAPILVCGSIFSLVSILNNSVLAWSLVRKSRRASGGTDGTRADYGNGGNGGAGSSHLYYVLVLAILDLIVSLCYIPVIGVDYLKDRLQSMELARLWWAYFGYLLTITHVAMSASCFILVFVSIERYLLTVRNGARLTMARRNRRALCALALVLALLMKAPMVTELELRFEPACVGTVSEYVVDLSAKCATLWYGTVYRFWMRHLVTVVVPFILIICFNLMIVGAIKAQIRSERNCARLTGAVQLRNERIVSSGFGRGYGSLLRLIWSVFDCALMERVRSATWTMVLLCFTYVLSNAANVFVTFWEFIDYDTLIQQYFSFYMTCTDLASMLAVLTCMLRLPTYLVSVRFCADGERQAIVNYDISSSNAPAQNGIPGEWHKGNVRWQNAEKMLYWQTAKRRDKVTN